MGTFEESGTFIRCLWEKEKNWTHENEVVGGPVEVRILSPHSRAEDF